MKPNAHALDWPVIPVSPRPAPSPILPPRISRDSRPSSWLHVSPRARVMREMWAFFFLGFLVLFTKQSRHSRFSCRTRSSETSKNKSDTLALFLVFWGFFFHISREYDIYTFESATNCSYIRFHVQSRRGPFSSSSIPRPTRGRTLSHSPHQSPLFIEQVIYVS